jgi:hypothetical protein
LVITGISGEKETLLIRYAPTKRKPCWPASREEINFANLMWGAGLLGRRKESKGHMRDREGRKRQEMMCRRIVFYVEFPLRLVPGSAEEVVSNAVLTGLNICRKHKLN